MTDQLFKYLEKIFFQDNHPKYRKYFPLWVSNLTETQIEGFKHVMEVDESGVLKQ